MTVSINLIHEACAGILNGVSNTIGTNTYYNAVNTTLTGDVCPVVLADASRLQGSGSGQEPVRPHPARP